MKLKKTFITSILSVMVIAPSLGAIVLPTLNLENQNSVVLSSPNPTMEQESAIVVPFAIEDLVLNQTTVYDFNVDLELDPAEITGSIAVTIEETGNFGYILTTTLDIESVLGTYLSADNAIKYTNFSVDIREVGATDYVNLISDGNGGATSSSSTYTESVLINANSDGLWEDKQFEIMVSFDALYTDAPGARPTWVTAPIGVNGDGVISFVTNTPQGMSIDVGMDQFGYTLTDNNAYNPVDPLDATALLEYQLEFENELLSFSEQNNISYTFDVNNIYTQDKVTLPELNTVSATDNYTTLAEANDEKEGTWGLLGPLLGILTDSFYNVTINNVVEVDPITGDPINIDPETGLPVPINVSIGAVYEEPPYVTPPAPIDPQPNPDMGTLMSDFFSAIDLNVKTYTFADDLDNFVLWDDQPLIFEAYVVDANGVITTDKVTVLTNTYDAMAVFLESLVEYLWYVLLQQPSSIPLPVPLLIGILLPILNNYFEISQLELKAATQFSVDGFVDADGFIYSGDPATGAGYFQSTIRFNDIATFDPLTNIMTLTNTLPANVLSTNIVEDSVIISLNTLTIQSDVSAPVSFQFGGIAPTAPPITDPGNNIILPPYAIWYNWFIWFSPLIIIGGVLGTTYGYRKWKISHVGKIEENTDEPKDTKKSKAKKSKEATK